MIVLKNIPEEPGCYIYKDKSGKITYIGKAKNLKKRVSSYFSNKLHDKKTQNLVNTISDVEFFVTGSEVEALILENNLIKKHKPKYNIDLRDSKRFAHILVTYERYPRLIVVRNHEIRGKYYGPFTCAEVRDHILKVLRSAFMLRTCHKIPKKACLRYYLHLCSAPCIGNISEEDYFKSIKNAENFLKGNTSELISKLRIDMKNYSSRLFYEKAKVARDQIEALESLIQTQRFEVDKKYDEDIINYIISDKKVYLIVFNVNKGILSTKNEFVFAYSNNFLDEFIVQHYSFSNVPKEIIIPQALEDLSIKDYLEKIRSGKVDLTVPIKGDKLKLLELVKKNIEVSFFSKSQMICALRDELELNSNPNIIECFDISNIAGQLSVGSIVQFRNGTPDKSNYRRFKIRTVEGADDFASIHEVVKRRYSRLRLEHLEMPDLVVIDGGRGQLSAAMNALKELELKIPIVSLAKKSEEIYTPGMILKLKKDSKALKILIQIRDEAHRFAIKYHRLLRSKEMISENIL